MMNDERVNSIECNMLSNDPLSTVITNHYSSGDSHLLTIHNHCYNMGLPCLQSTESLEEIRERRDNDGFPIPLTLKVRASLGQRHPRRAVLLVANNCHENRNVVVLASDIVLYRNGRG
jgi:hypothetical protein